MGSLKSFIEDAETEEHPTARAWIARTRRGERAFVTLWRKRDGLTYKRAKLYVTFETSAGPVREHDDWDPDIDEPLLREGIRAETEANEAQRFALLLRVWFAEVEGRFGPGYFESVLIDVLGRPPFANDEEFDRVLRSIPVHLPSREGRSYADCAAMVSGILETAARLLLQCLGYNESAANGILVAAIAQYLDERFQMTTRRMLGLG